MLAVNQLMHEFGGQRLFSGVSFTIDKNDRIGLVGRNGSGKSTLLKILSKQVDPKGGEVSIIKDKMVGYLPQEFHFKSTDAVFEEARKAALEIVRLEKEIESLNQQLLQPLDQKEIQKVLDKLSSHNERYQILGGYELNGKIENILFGLGFSSSDLSKPMNELSGGWQIRVELAKLLIQHPDVLLLDEPTNHLDIESIRWLESYLSNYPGCVILVSHDRTFLDKVVNRVFDLAGERIRLYRGNYSSFQDQKQQLQETLAAEKSNQQKQIDEITRFVERFRYKATKAKQVQSRVKSLEKMNKIDFLEEDVKPVHFSFPETRKSGKVVFETKNLRKSYGRKLVLESVDLAIIRDEKIAFVGKNGEGKSTMANILTKQIQYEGEAKLGHQVQIGYFAQNQTDVLDFNLTPIETMQRCSSTKTYGQIRQTLGDFLFTEDDLDKRVKVLSGGEKTRLAIACLLNSPSNLLVLDEPTHHLDMISKDVLKNALMQYEGTLVIISHDRDFLSGLTNKSIEFKNKGIKEYLGDITNYLEASSKELAATRKIKSAEPKTVSNKKQDWIDKKEVEKNRRKLQKQIDRSEKIIEEIENKLRELEGLLAQPDLIDEERSIVEITKEYEGFKKLMSEEMNSWESNLMELDKVSIKE